MAYRGNTKRLGRGRYRWGTFFLPFLGLLVAGCGFLSSKGTISGKVLYQGKPLPGGRVAFFTKDKGVMNSRISPDGDYTVYQVPVGEVKIAVQAPQAPRARAKGGGMLRMAQKEMKSGKVDPEKLPADVKQKLEDSAGTASAGQPVPAFPPHYADPEKSGLTYKVIGGKQTYDIELK